MTAPTVSVIVPIYNVAPYLDQCIESVLAQTHADFEVLLIDDGSTDDSPALCDSYAARDARVRVVHQANGGLSRARNAGLEAVRGQFVTFLDGDDWLEPDTLEASLRAATTHNADVVLWPYVREYRGFSLPKRLFDFDERFFDAQETRHSICRRMVGLFGRELSAPENADALVTACAKLYARDLLERSGAEFVDTQRIGTEDALFNLQVLTHAMSAVYLNRFLYHYRRDNASSLTTAHKPALPQQWSELHALMGAHIAQHAMGSDFEQALRNRISLSIIGLGLNALRSGLGVRRITQQVRAILTAPDYRAAVGTLEIRWLPPHWRVFFLAAKLSWALPTHALLRAMNAMRARRNRARITH